MKVVHQPTENEGWLDFQCKVFCPDERTMTVRVMPDGYMTADLVDESGTAHSENWDLPQVVVKANWKTELHQRIK